MIRFKRTAWRAVVVSDIIRKLRLMLRPYEKEAGETDRVAHWALEETGKIFGDAALTPGKQMGALIGVMESIRDRYQAVPLKEPPGSRPLIGVVGEIYIRLNSFSNQNIIRRIEAQGGEAWLADISEWVWYTIVEEERRLKERGRRFTPAMAGVKIRKRIQGRDEARLQAPFREMFGKRPETRVEKLLEYSKPYLPAYMAGYKRQPPGTGSGQGAPDSGLQTQGYP